MTRPLGQTKTDPTPPSSNFPPTLPLDNRLHLRPHPPLSGFPRQTRMEEKSLLADRMPLMETEQRSKGSCKIASSTCWSIAPHTTMTKKGSLLSYPT